MTTIVYITELTSINFKEFIQNGVALVDIYTIWCMPCKQISPIIDQLSIDYQGQISVGKLDADANKPIMEELGIRNIPTILIYKNGEIVDKVVGLTSKSNLSNLIENYL